MNNEQLVFVLDGIMNELSEAIEQARSLFDRPGIPQLVHRPNALCFDPRCGIPEHFQEITIVETLELVPLETLHAILTDRIERMRNVG